MSGQVPALADPSPRKALPEIAQSVRRRGADKSLAPPGRKQATATEDFDVHISYLLS
jgi:hypothetical protein